MASTSEDAIQLLKELDQEQTEKKILELQEQLNEARRLNETNVATNEKLAKENEIFKANTETLQRKIETLTNELNEKTSETNRQRKLRLTEQENLEASDKTIRSFEKELNTERTKVVQLDFNLKKAQSEVKRLELSEARHIKELDAVKSQIQTLKDRITEYSHNSTRLRQEHSNELKQYNEENRKLQAEGSYQHQQVISLETENSKLKGKLTQMTREIQDATEEREAVKLHSSALQSSYNSLQKLFTETSDHYDNRLVTIQADLQLSTDENKELRDKLKTAEEQLQEEKKLRQTYFNSFVSKDGRSSADTLNKLIYRYTEIHRHPEDIFKDFFDLNDSYEKAVKENVGLGQMVEHLTRKLTDQNNLLSRQHQELEERKDDVDYVQKSLEKEAIKYNRVKSDLDNTFTKLQESLQENQDLKKSMSDLKYQMKFILYDIERRGEPIPVQLHETFKLLEDTSIVPSLSHEQLAYKNISMLQEKNMDLVLDLRKANELVENLKNDYQNLKSSSENNKNIFEITLNESKEAIKSLQEQLTEVKADNESHINQLSALKSGLASSSSVNSAVQNQAQIDEDTEMTFDEFRRETLLDAEKMSTELFDARKQLAELKAQSQSWSTEKNSLQLDAMKLNNQVTLLQAELQRVNASSEDRLNKMNELHQQITSAQHLIDEAKTDASFWKLQSSSNEQQLKYAKQAQDDLKAILDQKSTDYENLINLFQQLSSQLNKVDSKDCDTLLRRIESLSSEIEEKTNLLAAKDAEITKLLALNNNDKETALSDAQTELRVLRKQLADTQENLIKSNTEKSLAETQLNAIQAQINNSNAPTGDAPTCTEHDGLIQTYQNKIAELEKVNFAYHEQTEELQRKIDALLSQTSSNASNAESFYKDLQKNLEVEIEKSKDLQKKNQEISENYQICLGQLSKKEADFNTERQKSNEKISTLEESLTKANEEFTALNEKLQQQESNLETAQKDLEAEKNNSSSLNDKITQLNANLEELKSEVEKTKNALNIANQTKTTLQSHYDQALEYQSKLKEDFQKEIKKFDEQNTVLNKHIEELVVKITSLSESQNDDLAKETTEEALEQLRRANDFLRAQKDLNEKNYLAEQDRCRLALNQIETYKQQLSTLKADLSALNDERDALLEKVYNNATEDRSFNEALKIQNTNLIQENEKLKKVKFENMTKQTELENTINQLNFKINSLEKTLESSKEEVNMLTKSNEEWSRRSSTILSKYHKIDPEEFDSMKTELTSTKEAMEALRSEKEAAEAKVEATEAKIKSLEAERAKIDEEKANLVRKCNERGRSVLEYKRKFEAADREAKSQQEQTSQQDTEAAEKLAALTNEKAQLTEDLKKKEGEYSVLEKRHAGILQKARSIQLENKRMTTELAELKKNGDTSSEKTTQLETELATLKKQLADSSVEISRYRAQTSMAQNKTAKLQKEVEALKIKLAESVEAENTVADKMEAGKTVADNTVADKTIADKTVTDKAETDKKETGDQPSTNEPDKTTHAQSLPVPTPQPTELSEARSPEISQALQVSPVQEEQKPVIEEPQQEQDDELKTPDIQQTEQASVIEEEHKSDIETPQPDKVEPVATIENETPAAVAEAEKLEQDIDELEMTGDDDVELESPSSPRIPKREREDEEEDGTESPTKKMK